MPWSNSTTVLFGHSRSRISVRTTTSPAQQPTATKGLALRAPLCRRPAPAPRHLPVQRCDRRRSDGRRAAYAIALWRRGEWLRSRSGWRRNWRPSIGLPGERAGKRLSSMQALALRKAAMFAPTSFAGRSARVVGARDTPLAPLSFHVATAATPRDLVQRGRHGSPLGEHISN